MTQETEKERIYREALDEINNLAIDVAMDFEETGIGSVDCGKIMDIVNKAFFAEANQQPSNTDKLSVEKLQEIRVEELKDFSMKTLQAELKNQKLQEQLNTAKKALTEAIEDIEQLNGSDDTIKYYKQALAAIGGDDD